MLLGIASTFAHALELPQLTGRVVDEAGIISPEAKTKLESKLAAHEDLTSNQLVVATVRSLQGTSIEDYANQLFRAWKLGQAKTNNGVLLLVAPNERKVRIEVGYGLEGTLTDALSKVIITAAIAPKFKAGDFAGGIEAGTDAVIGTLAGDTEWQERAKVREESDAGSYQDMIVPLIVIAFILVFFMMSARRAAQQGGTRTYHRTRNGRWIIVPGPTWGGGGGGWSGGGSGDWGGGAMSLITDDERRQIAEAIRAAEATTSGEIVCVVMRAASDYRSVPLLWAALLALAWPWPLIAWTSLSAHTIHVTQLVVFALLAIVLSFSAWRFRLVPRPVKRRRARQAAREQFFAQGLRRTKERSGVLIFVAEAEHYAEILVDDGIAAKVDNDAWREALACLADGLREGRPAAGMTGAIALCAPLLANHFPRSATDTNELPDKVVVI
ncbi:methanol dehydrogenase [Afipia sp. P52-10]|nr:methanol dehydrogenase [Afipia sp. P52-10]